jgi:hypothetical protein
MKIEANVNQLKAGGFLWWPGLPFYGYCLDNPQDFECGGTFAMLG